MKEKVSINAVSIDLGYDALLDAKALNKILYASNYKGLRIYFDNTVNATKTNASFDEIYENGELKDVMIEGDSIICVGRKTLVAEDNCRNEANFITVAQFIYKGKKYYPVDETGIWLEFKKFDLSQFYCIRRELDAYLKNIKDQASTGIAVKTKKQNKQGKREQAFKGWLENKANITVTKDTQYQECYKAINEPTQAQVWSMLQDVDKTLFSAGFDDFFKYQTIITFKTGTGKARC